MEDEQNTAENAGANGDQTTTTNDKDNVSRVSEIKAKLSAEIEKIEENIIEIKKIKQESIEMIELKKKELRELTNPAEICQEKDETMLEIQLREKEIEERKISLTLLDQTLANLDKQIGQIQSEHDKAAAELSLKKRKLNEQLAYYDALNQRLTDLLNLLEKEANEHTNKLEDLMQQRTELLESKDLSEDEIKRIAAELDAQIDILNKEHQFLMDCYNKRLSGIEITEPVIKQYADQFEDFGSELLTEDQIRELQEFESNLHETTRLSQRERLALLRQGVQITPSGRIITQNDRLISLEEARLLGLMAGFDDGEEEESTIPSEIYLKTESKPICYSTTPSVLSSSEKTSSIESELDQRDIEYLKRVFGKSLSLALAEITAVQPSDPIHYLGHWFIKYRFNQEINEVRRIAIQALMIEREKIEAERWHRELQEEAYLAVMEALFRAENIIRQQDYEKMEMMQEMEGEYELDDFNPMDFFNV